MIRDVRLADAARIAEIYNHYVERTTATFELRSVGVAAMQHRLLDFAAAGPCLVWEERGRVEGYCYVHPWKEKAAYASTLECTIYLAPDCTRRGWGRLLMERLVEACRERGVGALIACITAENEGSCRFHERLGFQQVSHFRRVGRKLGRWLDVKDYELLLTTPDE